MSYIKQILSEVYIYYDSMLNENRESKMRHAARHMAMQRGYSNEQARQLEGYILHNIPNSRLADFKFFPGIMRMTLDGELSNGPDILDMDSYLKLIAGSAHVNEYDSDFNGLSYNDIDRRFKTIRTEITDSEREESENGSFTENGEYSIVRIPDYESASKYGRYTDWCVTHSSSSYNDYTNNGCGLFYFCLKKGFENIPEIEGEGCPLDEYGLSMIAVSVNMDGSPHSITCRWNHRNGGNDNIMDWRQVETIIGRSFYRTFRPYTREELLAKGIIPFDEVQGLLDSGKKPEDIFNEIDDFSEGYAVVQLNGKYNFIDTEGRILFPDQWLDWCDTFNEGYAVVKLNGKYNFIDTEGRILSPDMWFDECYYFSKGYAKVQLNGKYNFIDTEGRILSPDMWFDTCYTFSKGYAKVQLNGKYNFIDTEGRILSPDQWLDWCDNFNEGYAPVKLNGKWYRIDTEGKWYRIGTEGNLQKH